MRWPLFLSGAVGLAIGSCSSGAPFEGAGDGASSGAGGQVSGSAGGAALPEAGAPNGSPELPTPECTSDAECEAPATACVWPACVDGQCAMQRAPEGAGCEGGSCDAEGLCVLWTCESGARDGDETGLDCGGGCGLCPDGQGCEAASDCLSGVCAERTCQASTCTDGAKNGSETDVDCGGSCPLRCGLDEGCSATQDCTVAAGDLPESVRCLDSLCTSTKPPAAGGAPRYWQDFAEQRLVSNPEGCAAMDKVCLVGNGPTYAMAGMAANGTHRPLTKSMLFSAEGAVGSAAKLDGTWCLTRPDTDLSLVGQAAVTGMAWIRTSRAAAPWESAIIGGFNHYFLALDANPASQRFLTALATSQSPSFDYRSAAGLGTIASGEWHHVAVVYSTTAGKLTQYVDGVAVHGFDQAGTTSLTPANVFIGCRRDASAASQFFIGSVDEIAIYQRALSLEEVSDYVRRTRPEP